MPALAVLPGGADEVRDILRSCHELRVPWVARGSDPAFPAERCPIEDELLIVLSRMRRILEVDLDNQRVVVEPGVTNTAVSYAVAPDFFYPPDPSSQIVCSIGGNVSFSLGMG